MAAEQTDPQLRQDYLDLEQKWLTLARSFETTERATESINKVTPPEGPHGRAA